MPREKIIYIYWKYYKTPELFHSESFHKSLYKLNSHIINITLMELLFNLCGEFRLSPEGPVSQVHSPHLHIGALGIFSDLLRPAQMLKWEWGEESNWKLPHLLIPSKSAILVTDFAVEDLPSAELQPWYLSLHWKTWFWAELQPLFLSLQWKICLWAGLQPWFLSLQWKTCLWAELQPWSLSVQWNICLRQNCNLGPWRLQ